MVAMCSLCIKVFAYFGVGYLIGQSVSVLFAFPQLVSTVVATSFSVVAILIFEEQVIPRLKRLFLYHLI